MGGCGGVSLIHFWGYTHIYTYTHHRTTCDLEQVAGDTMATDPYKLLCRLHASHLDDGFSKREFKIFLKKAGYTTPARQEYWFKIFLNEGDIVKLLDDNTGYQRCNGQSEPLYTMM